MESQNRYITRPAILKWVNWYPPFLGAGISVKHKQSDLNNIYVELKQRPWNKNYIGTHFGGSIYMMCDPFYMVILSRNLGADYIVVDKAASIQFLHPGRGTLRAHFHIPADQILQLTHRLTQVKKTTQKYSTFVLDQSGRQIAEVNKEIYVRRRGRLR